MKTRTLLLLSVVCGLAILLAGGVLLVQIVNRADVIAPSALGEPVRVGDMIVIVNSSREVPGGHEVDLVIGGVADPEGSAGFRMIAAARPAPLLADCGPIEIAPQPCTLVFQVSGSGGSRQLFYERGDQTARWVLVAP
jgi:hypothetical protein